tara:strand:- start:189 stop:389 length:201 start_codon:yes stop_codon:yes gene_type:complete
MFLLFKSAKIKSNTIENRKKIVCLFIEKYSSMENERISPVNPSDNIKTKLILSTEDHQLIRYFIIY